MPLRWDATTLRYRAANGQFVSRVTVIKARDSIVDEVRKQTDALTISLRDGAISVADWQAGMRDSLRAGHTLAQGIVFGGKANATPSDLGKLGVTLREQYKYLQRYAIQIEQGAPISLGRSRMYANAIRTAFLNVEKVKQKEAGKSRVIWHVTLGESCAGCVAAQGEYAIADAPIFGSHNCLTNCHCLLEYL